MLGASARVATPQIARSADRASPHRPADVPEAVLTNAEQQNVQAHVKMQNERVHDADGGEQNAEHLLSLIHI